MSNEEIMAKKMLEKLIYAEKENFSGLIEKLDDPKWQNIDYDIFVEECNKIGLQVFKGCDIKPTHPLDKNFFKNEWKHGRGIFIDRIGNIY